MSFDKYKEIIEEGDTVIIYVNIHSMYALEATPEKENKNGETPLYLAIKKGKQNIADLLSETKNRTENEIPKETYTNKDPCIICMKPRNQLYVLWPCGHTSLCEKCCIKVKLEPYSKCPSCRKPIKSYKKLFFQ